jgi:hypothetical protein
MWGASRISVAAMRALTIPPRTPRLLPKNQQNRERELPDLVLKIRAEWIRAGKFAPNPHAQSMGFFSPCPLLLGGQLQPVKLSVLIVSDLSCPAWCIHVSTPGREKTWVAGTRLRQGFAGLSRASPPKLSAGGQAGHDGGAAAYTGSDGRSADGITMTAATKIVVAKSRPRASNWNN